MWSPELAPVGGLVVANCGPAWVVISLVVGAACRHEFWPHPGSDLYVVVVGVEVGNGAVASGAVRADQAGQARR